jgi:hypothetical protein
MLYGKLFTYGCPLPVANFNDTFFSFSLTFDSLIYLLQEEEALLFEHFLGHANYASVDLMFELSVHERKLIAKLVGTGWEGANSIMYFKKHSGLIAFQFSSCRSDIKDRTVGTA